MLSFDFKKVEIFRSPSNFSNGNTTDNQGNLVTVSMEQEELLQQIKIMLLL